jgi:hypothetical protein
MSALSQNSIKHYYLSRIELTEQLRLKVVENTVLRKILGPWEKEVTRDCKESLCKNSEFFD